MTTISICSLTSVECFGLQIDLQNRGKENVRDISAQIYIFVIFAYNSPFHRVTLDITQQITGTIITLAYNKDYFRSKLIRGSIAFNNWIYILYLDHRFSSALWYGIVRNGTSCLNVKANIVDDGTTEPTSTFPSQDRRQWYTRFWNGLQKSIYR